MTSACRRVLALLVLCALGVPVGAASAVPPETRDPAHAKPVLPEAQQGRRALQSMSAAEEADAAERNGHSVESFRNLLSSDPAVWVHVSGRIFYVEHADASDLEAADEQSAPRKAGAWPPFPDAQAFELHSKPGSAHTAYLDFNGYQLPANKAWSDTQFPEIIPAGTYGGFGLDGNFSDFSLTERQYIQTVWRIVAEKYAPFDIDVTTQAPSSDAVNRTSSGDTTFGTRIVVTNDMAARGNVCPADPDGGCIGIAFVDVFNLVNDDFGPGFTYGTDGAEPAWVYTKFTSNGSVFSAGAVANVAAHELGHTLALYHDGIAGGSPYYGGHGAWFPIMGSSLRAVGHFTNGSSYAGELTVDGEGNPQLDPVSGTPNADDADVIAKAGAPLRADDIGGSRSLGQAAAYSENGFIERATDTDTFLVDRTCTNAPLTATASGIGLGQALDLKVTVRNPSNVIAAVADPATFGVPTAPNPPDTPLNPNTPANMDATATVPSAGSGVWSITVEGTGLAGSYTDYGSRGMYRLDVSGCGESGAFVPVKPARVLDTRPVPFNVGAPPVKVPGGGAVTFQVAGQGGVAPGPAAGAAVLNVAVLGGSEAGYVTAFPAGEDQPVAANLNFNAGQVISNHVTVKLGTDGKVTLFNGSSAPIDLIADVNGWYFSGTATANGTFTALSPKRFLDTRPLPDNVGAPVGKIGGQEQVDFAVAGVSPIPDESEAGAGVFNLAVTGTNSPGWITGFPTGTTKPLAANLNFLTGQTISNAATIKLGTDGKVSLANGSPAGKSTDIIADANGWFRTGAASVVGAFTPLDPFRLLDTRTGVGAPAVKVPAGGTLTLTVAGASGSGVPASGVDAAVFNLAVTNAGGGGYLTVHPADVPLPTAANLNFTAGQTVSNLVTVKLSSGGQVKIFNGSGQSIDLIADIAGWYKK